MKFCLSVSFFPVWSLSFFSRLPFFPDHLVKTRWSTLVAVFPWQRVLPLRSFFRNTVFFPSFSFLEAVQSALPLCDFSGLMDSPFLLVIHDEASLPAGFAILIGSLWETRQEPSFFPDEFFSYAFLGASLAFFAEYSVFRLLSPLGF